MLEQKRLPTFSNTEPKRVIDVEKKEMAFITAFQEFSFPKRLPIFLGLLAFQEFSFPRIVNIETLERN